MFIQRLKHTFSYKKLFIIDLPFNMYQIFIDLAWLGQLEENKTSQAKPSQILLNCTNGMTTLTTTTNTSYISSSFYSQNEQTVLQLQERKISEPASKLMAAVVEIFRKLWNEWQLRGPVLVSLVLQIILIFTAKLRKRNSSKFVTFILWMAYLCADWVATFALGIISNMLTHPHSYTNRHNPDILSFWTPFLLLHLGGPDAITAFSLEDNELWLRHALALLLQVIVVLYIFVRSMRDSKVIIPTLCVCIAGMLKYGERTWALKCASMDGLRGSMVDSGIPGPDYMDIVDNFSSKLNAGIPAKLEAQNESQDQSSANDDDSQVGTPLLRLEAAYKLFQNFKRLFVDLILSFKEKNESQSIFSRISDMSQAYDVVAVELNFVYDALYTKAFVAQTSIGRVIRVTSFCLIVSASLVFFSVDKDRYHETDVTITYLLFVGALALEIVSLIVLIVSDWTVVLLEEYPKLKQSVYWILRKFRSPNKPRWSHSMGQYSLIKFCLHDDRNPIFTKFLAVLNAEEFFDKFWYMKYINISQDLKTLIWNDLKKKSTEDKSVTTCRGEMALEQDGDSRKLKWSIDVEFDESLLLWHIATDICYCLLNTTDINSELQKYREASMLISRYMLYLLLECPFTLSQTAGLGLIRYRDTCAELFQFFKKEELIGHRTSSAQKTKESEACEMLLFVHTDIEPVKAKGDRSKSVLWDAVVLAKQLKELDEVKMWHTIFGVWIEILCFAARHSRGDCHAQLLSVGGELLTFVWLLEAHLGMGKYFQIKSGHARTIVILEN